MTIYSVGMAGPRGEYKGHLRGIGINIIIVPELAQARIFTMTFAPVHPGDKTEVQRRNSYTASCSE